MNIFIIGGDGFCGWPTALELSNAGHAVHIVDNLSRRKIDLEIGVDSLTPISPIGDRIKKWHEISGKTIQYHSINVESEFYRLLDLFRKYNPESVVHFGEQRAAPYSMIGHIESEYTVRNNVLGTMNLLECVRLVSPDCHFVHLGTMGVYGYGSINTVIPDGYLPVEIDTLDGKQTKSIVYPPDPGSIYHLTKTVDHQFFQFYSKNYNLKVTDLHQGVVWGTNTDLTLLDPKLVNRFDYDGHYGTVLNRFLVQGHIKYPLTVYGTGGQTRAFIHISDTTKCVRLAIENEPKDVEVRIFNQISECYNVKELAELVSKITGTGIQFIDNPRKELAENKLHVSNAGLESLGFEPTLLHDSLFKEVEGAIKNNTDRINLDAILPTAKW